MSCLTAQFCNPRLPLFVQVAQTDSVRHLNNCGMLPNGLFSRHQLLSQLMSASCIHPGLGTVIDNLMQSFSDEQDPDRAGQPWQTDEYFPGAGMEIYEVRVCLWYCVLDSNGLCMCVCVCVCVCVCACCVRARVCSCTLYVHCVCWSIHERVNSNEGEMQFWRI